MSHLSVEDVSKRFGGTIANDKVSLTVAEGEIVGLIGPNGSGKTTLFNSISGHHRTDAGRIVFNGRDITSLSVSEIARFGLVRTFQHTRVYRSMTCLENMCISLPHGYLTLPNLPRMIPRAMISSADQLLAFVGLQEHRDAVAGELSFGQQRMLEIAMTLMSKPTMLLLDEPTAGINPKAIQALVTCLQKLRTEFQISLLIVEHNMKVILELADRIYCLKHGAVLAQGTPPEIKADEKVAEAYLGVV